MTKIGSVVHFYRYLFSNTSPLFYWIYCDSHITIKVTFCLVYYSDMYKSNHCKIPINSSVINIDWYSFNFDHIIFVFIIARTIWTSKLKHSIVLVMVIKVGGVKNNRFFIQINQESVAPNISHGKDSQYSTINIIRWWEFLKVKIDALQKKLNGLPLILLNVIIW